MLTCANRISAKGILQTNWANSWMRGSNLHESADALVTGSDPPYDQSWWYNSKTITITMSDMMVPRCRFIQWFHGQRWKSDLPALHRCLLKSLLRCLLRWLLRCLLRSPLRFFYRSNSCPSSSSPRWFCVTNRLKLLLSTIRCPVWSSRTSLSVLKVRTQINWGFNER